MSFFERYLTIWVALCILVGIALGEFFPDVFFLLSQLEYASVNLLIAILIWAMVYPMMVAVDLKSLHRVAEQPKGLIITFVVNWLLKPFTMAALGVIFFRWLFADFIPAKDAESYIAGLILLGAAPCTAMVFVWSHLTSGDPNYTLVQVSLNDVIMVFAFAPLVAFLLGVTDIPVPWETLLLSVGLYVIVPLIAGVLTRNYLLNSPNDNERLERFNTAIKPYSIMALLGTIVLLFGFQGEVILDRPVLIVLIAIPLLIQSYGIFAIGYFLAWRLRVPFKVAAPCAMIGTSNFFELAVAVAISLFGLKSGAALATVVGVLVEVPVMLSLVAFANKTKFAFRQS
jgi:ACR3 family arsenite transporter